MMMTSKVSSSRRPWVSGAWRGAGAAARPHSATAPVWIKSSACFHKDLEQHFPVPLERIIAGVNRKRASESGLRARRSAFEKKSPKGNGMIRASKDFPFPRVAQQSAAPLRICRKTNVLGKRYTGFDISGIPQ